MRQYTSVCAESRSEKSRVCTRLIDTSSIARVWHCRTPKLWVQGEPCQLVLDSQDRDGHAHFRPQLSGRAVSKPGHFQVAVASDDGQ